MRKAGGQRSASRIYAHGGVMEREAGGRGGLVSGRAPFVMLTWPSPLASTVSLESPPAPMSIEPNRGWPAGLETGSAAFNKCEVFGEISLRDLPRGDSRPGTKKRAGVARVELRARCNADMIGVSGRKRKVSALTSGSDAKLARRGMPLR